jgi:hypothetical protein
MLPIRTMLHERDSVCSAIRRDLEIFATYICTCTWISDMCAFFDPEDDEPPILPSYHTRHRRRAFRTRVRANAYDPVITTYQTSMETLSDPESVRPPSPDVSDGMPCRESPTQTRLPVRESSPVMLVKWNGSSPGDGPNDWELVRA